VPTPAPSGMIEGVTDSWAGDHRVVRAFRHDPARDVVRHWRLFLAEPDSYFRRLL
jgi:hypothetical protein